MFNKQSWRTWDVIRTEDGIYLLQRIYGFESAKNVEFWITLSISINLMLDRIKTAYDVFEIFSLLTIIAYEIPVHVDYHS